MMTMQTGVVDQVRYRSVGGGKVCEAKIVVDGRTTNWLPVKGLISKYAVEWTPPRSGDQVEVHNPHGDGEDGFVGMNIAYASVTLPEETNENTHIRKTHDGTTYLHNTASKEISLTTPCSYVIDAPNIKLDKAGNLWIKGEITDKLGNLTKHKHAVKNHSVAVPR